MFKPPGECPVCGSPVPKGAKACPACGADDRSGWNEIDEDGLDLPGGDFDYEDFTAREFGGKKSRNAIHPVWWFTAVILLLASMLGFFLHLW